MVVVARYDLPLNVRYAIVRLTAEDLQRLADLLLKAPSLDQFRALHKLDTTAPFLVTYRYFFLRAHSMEGFTHLYEPGEAIGFDALVDIHADLLDTHRAAE